MTGIWTKAVRREMRSQSQKKGTEEEAWVGEQQDIRSAVNTWRVRYLVSQVEKSIHQVHRSITMEPKKEKTKLAIQVAVNAFPMYVHQGTLSFEDCMMVSSENLSQPSPNILWNLTLLPQEDFPNPKRLIFWGIIWSTWATPGPEQLQDYPGQILVLIPSEPVTSPPSGLQWN